MHIHMNRTGKEGAHSSYICALPSEELTMTQFWNRDTMIEIDSFNLINEVQESMRTYNFFAKEFAEFEHTKYNMDEWYWAFNIANSRVTILDNDNNGYLHDPEYESMITPLAEYLNHSFDPNVVLTKTISNTLFGDMDPMRRSENTFRNIKGTERVEVIQ